MSTVYMYVCRVQSYKIVMVGTPGNWVTEEQVRRLESAGYGRVTVRVDANDVIFPVRDLLYARRYPLHTESEKRIATAAEQLVILIAAVHAIIDSLDYAERVAGFVQELEDALAEGAGFLVEEFVASYEAYERAIRALHDGGPRDEMLGLMITKSEARARFTDAAQALGIGREYMVRVCEEFLAKE